MVGIRRFKLLIGIIIPFLCFFLMSQNTIAVTPSRIASTMAIYRSSVSPNWTNKVTDHNQGLPVPILSNQGQTLQLRQLNVSTRMANSQTGQYYGGSFEITLYFTFSNPMYVNSMLPACENISSVTLQPEQGTVVSNSFSVQACSGDYIMIPQYTQPIGYYFKVKVHGAGKLSQSTAVQSYVLAIRSTEEKPFYTINLPSASGSMGVTLQSLDINFSVSNDSSMPGQSDINQNITNINNTINEQNKKEQQAIDNISNQSQSDINNAENPATTNLIGVLSGFVNAFSNINATNCSLTLEFPNYAGGSRVVDICQGKDKAPRIVEIGSSLLLIAVFVPLAYILIKMIYNEIRSWTNG